MPHPPYTYRSDPSVPLFPDDKAVIIFDGHCVVCSGWARFVLRWDKRRRYRLLPAQTPLGEALFRHYGLSTDDYQTNILIEDGVAWFKSSGTLKMFWGLGLPWSLAVVLVVLPQAVRDRLYEWVAKNRFRWFGRREVCYLAETGEEDRFLR